MGSVTLTILLVLTSTTPEPSGSSVMLPSVSCEDIVLEVILILPIVTVVNALGDGFIDTAPDETSKSAVAKDAIPLFDTVASSPAIVIVLSDTVVSIPSPPVKFSVSVSKSTGSSEPLSAPIVSWVVSWAQLNPPLPSVLRYLLAVPSSGQVYVYEVHTAFGAL